MPTSRREAWTPEKRAAAREAARIQWSDEDGKAAAVATGTIAAVRAAVEKDPTMADVLIAAALQAKGTWT